MQERFTGTRMERPVNIIPQFELSSEATHIFEGGQYLIILMFKKGIFGVSEVDMQEKK